MSNEVLYVILGPTATGKTALAAHLAHRIGGEIISADSRQVYRGMDIGTGKDLEDYIVEGASVACHLIDIAEPGEEYNIYQFQKDFYSAFSTIVERKKIPVLCGGSGMYLEAVLKGYRMPEEETDGRFLEELSRMSDDQLEQLLIRLKPLHNKTDLEDRDRMIKAIRVAMPLRNAGPAPPGFIPPSFRSVIAGIRFPREVIMQRIAHRLQNRLDHGLIDEVEKLLASGLTPERLIRYGLEYKYVTLYLRGEIDRTELFELLNIAIRQFAKRQMTWFRRMERQGFPIGWIDGNLPMEEKIRIIMEMAGQKT